MQKIDSFEAVTSKSGFLLSNKSKKNWIIKVKSVSKVIVDTNTDMFKGDRIENKESLMDWELFTNMW